MDRPFWQALYKSGRTPFDMGGPTPVLVDWLDRAQPKPGRAVVPGCGRGYDVIELARRGWTALGIDFAATAVSDGRKLARAAGLEERARFLEQDLFAAAPEPVELWWEHTCYCAIEPARRDEYAALAARWVQPHGTLLFLAFPIDGRQGGPPFAIGAEEVPNRFAPWFAAESSSPPPRPSAPGRVGRERLAVLRKLA